MQCGTSHLQTVQENILSHIILATYRKFTVATVIFTQNVSCNIYTHPFINKWQMSLCNNSSDNKSNWIHRVDVKVSAQVATITYMHQSQPSSHSPLSYFSFQPVLHNWCNKGRGMCYPVCRMVHIKEPLLLIDKSSLCGGSGFPFLL